MAELAISLDLRRSAVLTHTPTNLRIHLTRAKNSRLVEVDTRNVLWADSDDNGHVKLQFLHKDRGKAPFVVTSLEGQVKVGEVAAANTWVDNLMDAAYAGLKRQKRLLVLVNPYGGPGKAPSLFKTRVEPILKAARCQLDVRYTTHRFHAQEIAKDISFDFDAVLSVSGDGLIHELVNGFMQHQDPVKAFSTPIVQIPSGSANGLSLNVLGLKDGFNVPLATLNAIKGKPMKVDVCSFTQKGKRSISFFSQTAGLMADLDLKTEHLRWMGDKRFVYGFLRGVLQFKTCPIELHIKAAPENKDGGYTVYRSSLAQVSTGTKPCPEADFPPELLSPPSRSHAEHDGEGWIKFDKPLVTLVAGKGPYTSRDLMQFPVSLADDGYLDVVVTERTRRSDYLQSFDGAAQGSAYWADYVRYFKATAYRVKPLSSEGCLSIDGEAFPFEEFLVEVHPKVMTLLSPYGRYAAEFDLEKRRV